MIVQTKSTVTSTEFKVHSEMIEIAPQVITAAIRLLTILNTFASLAITARVEAMRWFLALQGNTAPLTVYPHQPVTAKEDIYALENQLFLILMIN